MRKEDEFSGLKIKDVKRIWEVPGTEIEDENDIRRLVESPLVNAVAILFGKGIRTYWSTANSGNSFAAIAIEPRELSEKNLDIAKEKLGYEGREDENVLLERPITPDTPVSEVDEYFVVLAGQFEDQQK